MSTLTGNVLDSVILFHKHCSSVLETSFLTVISLNDRSDKVNTIGVFEYN